MIYSVITGLFLGGVVLFIGQMFDDTMSPKSKQLVMKNSRDLFLEGQQAVKNICSWFHLSPTAW